MEADLRRFRAASPKASLLERVEACTDATWTELDPVEISYEQHLREIAPAGLPPGLMAALVASGRDIPFSKDHTIVRFPQKKSTTPQHHRTWWGAAAAVALVGAVTALLIPVNHGADNLAEAGPKRPINKSTPTGGELIPAGFNRGLSEASDQGVIWQSNQQPHRVLKVVYMERVTYKGTAGQTYQMEQPRVEYYLVPTKTD